MSGPPPFRIGTTEVLASHAVCVQSSCSVTGSIRFLDVLCELWPMSLVPSQDLQWDFGRRVTIPGSNLTGEAHIGIFIHGTDSEAALNILKVGRLRNGSAEPIGVYGCPVESPSVMHVNYGAKIFYQVCAFPLTKNGAKAYANGPYPPGTLAHNPCNRKADGWLCGASSTEVARIILDFRVASDWPPTGLRLASDWPPTGRRLASKHLC